VSGPTEAGASFLSRRDELSRNDNVPKHVAEAYDRGLYAIIKRCFTRVGTSEDHNGNPCAVLSSTTWYAALSVN
jgi:hypothetical protein